ncbi:MAG: hypothetical protein U0797_06080 [Gemmataceae bacterium]
MWEQSARLATLISTKVVRKQLSDADHRALLGEALAEFRRGEARKQTLENARMSEQKLQAPTAPCWTTSPATSRVYAEALYKAGEADGLVPTLLEEAGRARPRGLQAGPRPGVHSSPPPPSAATARPS